MQINSVSHLPITPIKQRQRPSVRPVLTTSPAVYFEVKSDRTHKKVQIPLPPEVKKSRDVIYKFKRIEDGASYIGMTNNLAKRLSSHISAINNPRSEAGQSALAKAVRKDASGFVFGILTSINELRAQGIHAELDQLETEYIERQKKKGILFNKRTGGGGGRAKSKKPTKSQADVSLRVACTYKSPSKSYPLDTNYKVLLTPSAKGDLYILKRTSEQGARRYVGKTGRPIGTRLSEHSHYARHAEKIRSQKSELYQEIHQNPEQFCVKMLDSKELGGEDIDQTETGLIEFFQSEGAQALYNKNQGGGGGHPKCKLSF